MSGKRPRPLSEGKTTYWIETIQGGGTFFKHIRTLTYPQLAVQDLEFLRDLSPDESNVVFQLARVYRLLGDKVKSAQLLAVARDVSPKSVKKIERLLELSKDEDAEAMDED